MADFDDGEPCAVGEVGHVDDGEHHQECAEHRSRGKQLRLRGELFRHRLTGVVAVTQNRRRHHHEAHRERLPDQRELECGAGEYRAPRDHLRIDVHARVHELDLQPRIEDEADRQRQQAHADQRMSRHERRRPVLGLQFAQDPDCRKVGAEVEHHVTENHERFDGRRQRHQRPRLRPVDQVGVVDRERRPVHDRVLPHDQRGAQEHQHHRAARIAAPAPDEHDQQHGQRDQGADVQKGDVVQPEKELHRAWPAMHVRVGHARVEGDAAVRDEEEREGRQGRTRDPPAPAAFVAPLRCGRIVVRGKRCRLAGTHFLLTLPLRSGRRGVS